MKDYSYSELGMLFGAAAGGAAAIIAFSATGNALSFVLAAIGIAAGIAMGNKLEKNKSNGGKNKNAAK